MEKPKVNLFDAVERVKARLRGKLPLKRHHVDDRDIRRWIRFACEKNGVPELSQVITVEWNRRFTRRMGDAFYSPFAYKARIRLSTPLWERASYDERRDTVIHETCHVIAAYKFGYLPPHGPEWRKAMRKCGVEPIRGHTVDRTGLARRQRRYVLCDCPTEKKCRIGVRLFNRVRRDGEFRCEKCGLQLGRKAMVEEGAALQRE
jgi:SprT protein